jgi:hypothetical protein
MGPEKLFSHLVTHMKMYNNGGARVIFSVNVYICAIKSNKNESQ